MDLSNILSLLNYKLKHRQPDRQRQRQRETEMETETETEGYPIQKTSLGKATMKSLLGN